MFYRVYYYIIEDSYTYIIIYIISKCNSHLNPKYKALDLNHLVDCKNTSLLLDIFYYFFFLLLCSIKLYKHQRNSETSKIKNYLVLIILSNQK